MLFQILHNNPDRLNHRNRMRKTELQERRLLLNESSPVVMQLCQFESSGYPAKAPASVEVFSNRSPIIVSKPNSGLTTVQDIITCDLPSCNFPECRKDSSEQRSDDQNKSSFHFAIPFAESVACIGTALNVWYGFTISSQTRSPVTSPFFIIQFRKATLIRQKWVLVATESLPEMSCLLYILLHAM